MNVEKEILKINPTKLGKAEKMESGFKGTKRAINGCLNMDLWNTRHKLKIQGEFKKTADGSFGPKTKKGAANSKASQSILLISDS